MKFSKKHHLTRFAAIRSSCFESLRWQLLALLGSMLLVTLIIIGACLLLLVDPNDQAVAALRGLTWTVLPVFGLGLALFGLLIALVTAHFLKQQLFQPLASLQAGLEQIGQGDLSYRVDMHQKNEVGQLLAAFNEMSGRLADRDEQLAGQTTRLNTELAEYTQMNETLQLAHSRIQRHNRLLAQVLEAGHSLQRNLNPSSLFQEIVEAIHRSVGFEIVVLSLVDQDSRQVRVRACVGLGEEGRQLLEGTASPWEDFAILLQERFRIGRCYFFPYDALNHEPDSQGVEVEPTASGAGLSKAWHPDDSLLVPIELRPGQIAGIFSLGQPLNGLRPDPATLQALELFASQAAAAIENARLYEQVQQDLIERKRTAEELRQLNEELEERVLARTAELARTNETLQTEILERQRVEEQIKASLKEKEVLLQEIHHRVKNNLQIISSLLSLQASYLEDQEVREVFQDSQHRVRSMALVHEKLYRSHDLARIDLADYIQNLATFLFRSYRSRAGLVTLDIQADDVFLGIDVAVPCGLMLNELISNALKHAFPDGRTGQIRVELRASDDQLVTLIVSDNGVGFPADFDFENTTSLGMQLVDTLVDQLEGTLEIHSQAGTEFKITFPIPS